MGPSVRRDTTTMDGFQDLEQFIDALCDTFRANLNERIRVINGERTDFEIPEVNPEAVIPFGESVVITYPSVEVAAPDWNFGRPSIDQRDWTGTAVVMARAWWQHPDFHRLTRGLYRYGRAMSEVMSEPGAVGPHESVQSMRGFYRVNPETNERAEFTAGALIIMTVELVGVRP